jgi:hypothetical protein
VWNEPGPPLEPNDFDPDDFGWDAGGSSSWQQYAQLLRRLDLVRAIEQGRTEGIRQGVAQMSDHAETLGEYLSEQREMLMVLATSLRYKLPDWSPIPPEQGDPGDEDEQLPPERRAEHGDETDANRAELAAADDLAAAEPPPAAPRQPARPREPQTALGDVARLIDQANLAAERADEAGAAPAFLPHWSATSRNLLIYGLCALLTLLLQSQLFVINKNPSPFTTLGIIPGVCFLIGFLLIRNVGAPRIGRGSRRRSAKTGAIMCFGILPVAWLLLVIAR